MVSVRLLILKQIIKTQMSKWSTVQIKWDAKILSFVNQFNKLQKKTKEQKMPVH